VSGSKEEVSNESTLRSKIKELEMENEALKSQRADQERINQSMIEEISSLKQKLNGNTYINFVQSLKCIKKMKEGIVFFLLGKIFIYKKFKIKTKM